jgi:hypothetical protein
MLNEGVDSYFLTSQLLKPMEEEHIVVLSESHIFSLSSEQVPPSIAKNITLDQWSVVNTEL